MARLAPLLLAAILAGCLDVTPGAPADGGRPPASTSGPDGSGTGSPTALDAAYAGVVDGVTEVYRFRANGTFAYDSWGGDFPRLHAEGTYAFAAGKGNLSVGSARVPFRIEGETLVVTDGQGRSERYARTTSPPAPPADGGGNRATTLDGTYSWYGDNSYETFVFSPQGTFEMEGGTIYAGAAQFGSGTYDLAGGILTFEGGEARTLRAPEAGVVTIDGTRYHRE